MGDSHPARRLDTFYGMGEVFQGLDIGQLPHDDPFSTGLRSASGYTRTGIEDGRENLYGS